MEIRVGSEQAKLLSENAETRDLTARLLRNDAHEMQIILSGSLNDIDALRDACSDLLLRIGFDESYTATPVGSMLEDLIDKLYLG